MLSVSSWLTTRPDDPALFIAPYLQGDPKVEEPRRRAMSCTSSPLQASCNARRSLKPVSSSVWTVAHALRKSVGRSSGSRAFCWQLVRTG